MEGWGMSDAQGFVLQLSPLGQFAAIIAIGAIWEQVK